MTNESDDIEATINEQIAKGWLIPLDDGTYKVTDKHPEKEELEERHRQEVDDALVELLLQGKVEVKGLEEDGTPIWGVTPEGWDAYKKIMGIRGGADFEDLGEEES